MKKIKVGVFTGFFLPHLGGVERYVDKLSSQLEALGYECVIVTTRHDESLPTKEQRDTRTIYRLPTYKLCQQRYPIIKKTKLYTKMMQHIADEAIDFYIVNTRFHSTSFVGAKLARRQSRPVALIEHGTAHFSVGNRLLDFFGMIYEHALTMLLKRHVDMYFGVSKNCNQWLAHFHIQPDGVWYNAVDPNDSGRVKSTYNQIFEEGAVVITYAGRLIEEKGVLNLVDAFEKVAATYPNKALYLAIAGDGALYERLKARQRNMPKVRLLGRLDFQDVMSLYARSDIFVYPSLYPEGLPTSILEAGLMGAAVIATPRGGTEEVIVDREHGIIINGSTSSLVDAITIFLNDPPYRKRCGKHIQKRIQTVFSWRSVAMTVAETIKARTSHDDK